VSNLGTVFLLEPYLGMARGADDMATTYKIYGLDDWLDEIRGALGSRISKYDKWLSYAASLDLYKAYHVIMDNIQPGMNVSSAVRMINSGIEIAGKYALSRYGVSTKYGISYLSTNRYGDRIRKQNRAKVFTDALQININNRLDLVLNQGIIALPEFSEHDPSWQNHYFIQRKPNVTLGSKRYSEKSPNETLDNYILDIANNKNDGEHISDVLNRRIPDDINKVLTSVINS